MALTTIPASLSATALTLTTAAQPNITSVGTLTGLTVSGNASVTANLPTFTITGQGRVNGFEIAGTSGDTTLTEKSNNGITLGTNNTSRLRIQNNGDISFYEDTGTTAKFFWDSSAESLGIGTTSPFFTTAGRSSLSINGSTSSILAFGKGGSSENYILADAGGLTIANTSTTLPTIFFNNGSERMYIDSSGNVGITGQTSPTFNLDGGFVTQTWGWHLNTSYQAGFTYTTTDRSLSIFTKSADNADYIKFSTGGSATERMRIDFSGRVGIGIINPTEKFTVVNSSSGIVGRFTNNTNQTLDLGVISGSGAAGGVYYNNANSGYHAFQVGGTERMRITSAGILQIAGGGNDNVGELNFGNTAQNANRLQIRYQSSAWILKTVDTEPLLFGTANTERMRIDNSASSGYLQMGAFGVTGLNTLAALHGLGNEATLVISNTDLSTSAASYGWAGRAGRYLTSNGTNWDVDGRDPALVIGQNTATDNRGQGIGIILHNESNTNGHYGPIVGWGTKSESNSYNTMYAYIVGKKTGAGIDTNWSKGELQFDTAGLKPNGSNAYMTDTPSMIIDDSGAVTKPHQPHIRLQGNSATRVTNHGSTVTAFVNFNIATQRGITFNSGNGLVTLPVGGTYLVQYSFYLWMNNVGHGVNHSVALFRNSSMQQESIWESPDHTPGGSYVFDNTLSNSLILDCAAGDTLRWQCYADIYGGTVHTNASIYLLG